jgi:hypothetical protein
MHTKRIMRALAIFSLAAFLISPAFGNPFEYGTWKNKQGKSFEARVERIVGESVTLQAKNGGQRYTMKRSVFSEESESQLKSIIEAVETSLNEIKQDKKAPPISSDLVYKSVALGLTDQLLTLTDKVITLKITDVSVTNRLLATIEFEGGCFAQFQAKSGGEFFIKDKTLFARSSAKGTPDEPFRRQAGSVNEGSEQLLQTGNTFNKVIGPRMILEWGRVGVTEGPLFK